MSETPLDVVGIGNAIVDVLAHADEGFLESQGLTKGTMTLVEADEAERVYAQMGPGVACSGGSAANTMAGLASFGGTAAYIGKVRDDQLGEVFMHDLRATGVRFETPPAGRGPSTARCLILVTPDAERTMLTYLGASVSLSSTDIAPALIRSAQITYLEGYLWDPPEAKQAFISAARIAHDAGRLVALTLSDPFCVDRHRDSFLDLVSGHVDILFANESEITALFRSNDFDEALQHVRDHCQVAALTRSEKGAVILSDGELHIVDAAPAQRVEDTTGAGDLFASGFLYGYTHGLNLAQCGQLGALAAAEVISHFGARPATDLSHLARNVRA